MKCPKCGQEFEGNYCSNCGYSAARQPASPAGSVQPPVQEGPVYRSPAIQNPQAKKKHGGLIAALVVVGIGVVIAAASQGGKNSPAAGSSSGGETRASAAAAVSAASAAAKDTSKSYGIGEPATSGGITMTLNSVTESNGSQYNKPADGKVFLLCEFTIDNQSSSDLTISSLASFEAYVDNYSVNESLTATLLEKGSKNQLDGKIATGKKMNGIIGYEVPSDWKEIEIQLKPNVFSLFSGKTVFQAAKG